MSVASSSAAGRRAGIRTLLIYGISAMFLALMPIFVLPIVANALGPADFGLLSTVRYTMQLGVLFVGSFLGFGLARVFSDVGSATYYGRINGANLISAGLAVLAFGALLFLLPVLGIALPGGVSAVVLGGIMVLGAVVTVWRQNYHRILIMIPRPATAAVSEVLFGASVFGSFLVSMALGLSWFEMFVVQVGVLLLNMLLSTAMTLYLRGAEGIGSLDWSWSYANIWRSAPFLIVGLVTPMLLSVDKYVITASLGLEAMGIYAVTSIYLSGVILLAGIFQKFYVPIMYRSFSMFTESGDWDHVAMAHKRMWMGVLASVALIALVSAVVPFHARLTLDERYSAAAGFAPLVAMAGCSAFVQVALIPFFDVAKRGTVLSVLAFGGFVLSMLGVWIGARLYGLPGAAGGLFLGQASYCACALGYYSYRGPVWFATMAQSLAR